MRNVVLDDDYFQGAVAIERGGGWLRPWRLPFHDFDLFMPSQRALIERARESAGVRLRFMTDSERLELSFRPLESNTERGVHKIDLTVGAEIVRTREVPRGSASAMFDALPPGKRVVEIWLPQDTGIQVERLRVNDGAVCEPAEDSRPRWVTYGSSLTHCRLAHSPARTWPAIVARRAGFNLTCLGYGGNCCLEPALGLMIRDMPADLITLKLGINCIGGALSGRTFGPAVMGLLRIIREKHARTPLGVISPIAYPPHETAPNVVGNTIAAMRRDVAEAAAKLRRRGDGRIADFSGLDLLDERENAVYTGDQCHPNGDGIELMAEHFLERILPGLAPVSAAACRPRGAAIPATGR